MTILEQLLENYADYVVHPAVLDACSQAITGAIPAGDKYDGDTGVYLPVELAKVHVLGSPTGRLWSHARIVEKDEKNIISEVRVYDEQGNLLVEMLGFRSQRVDGGSRGGAPPPP